MLNTDASLYLGIDPSLASTGIALITPKIKASTELKTQPNQEKVMRLHSLKTQFVEFMLRYAPEKQVTLCCIEGASYNSFGRHDDLGMVRGILSLTALDYCLQIVTVPPRSLKKYATGRGEASKEEMVKKAIAIGWSIQEQHDDAADAALLAELAFGITNQHSLNLTRAQLEVLKSLKLLKE
jgi:crossover junction endodeoxyribonuclease RuvC